MQAKHLFLLSKAIGSRSKAKNSVADLNQTLEHNWDYQLSKLDAFALDRRDTLILDTMLIKHYDSKNLNPTFVREDYKIMDSDIRYWEEAFYVIRHLICDLKRG